MKKLAGSVSEEPHVLRRHAEPVTLAEALQHIEELYGTEFAQFCRSELADIYEQAIVTVRDLIDTLKLAFAHFKESWFGGEVDEDLALA